MTLTSERNWELWRYYLSEAHYGWWMIQCAKPPKLEPRPQPEPRPPFGEHDTELWRGKVRGEEYALGMVRCVLRLYRNRPYFPDGEDCWEVVWTV